MGSWDKFTISGNISLKCENLTRVELLQMFSNGKFLDQFAASLQNLSIRHSEMHDLTMFPSFTKLAILDLSDNQLQSLEAIHTDLSLPSVTVLYIQGNKLAVSIPFTFQTDPSSEHYTRLVHFVPERGSGLRSA